MHRLQAGKGSAERSFQLLTLVAVMLPVVGFLAAAWYDYRQVTIAERHRVVAAADALAEHAQKVLETNDLVLALVAERIEGLTWDEIGQDRPLHAFLARMKNELPQIESVFLANPEGKIAASSRAFPMFPYDISARDYYAASRERPGQLFVSAPFRGMMAGTIAFTISRGLPGGGMVGVTVSPDYFRRFYNEISNGTDSPVVLLLRDDAVILGRYPDGQDTLPVVPADSPVRAALAGTGPTFYLATSTTDGRRRCIAFRRLQGFPVAVIYGASVESYLAVWYRHSAVLAVFAMLTSAMLAVATRFAMLRTRGEQEKLRRLLEETERREQAEAALRQTQKLDALGRLTGGIAHDFNNVLAAVIGGLDLASRRNGDPKLARLLAGAMEAAQRGARLTQQMLAISRHEKLRIEPVDINAVLRNIEEMLQRSLGSHVVIHQDLATGLWPALADRTQLEVSILNLAINARDAMPEGGTLRLKTANLSAGADRPSELPAGDFAVLLVEDTGTGMPPDVLRRATEPFFTTKDVGRGTGLGLSMVDSLARQAGGALTIESALGQGTAVSLFLPRAQPAREVPEEGPELAVSRSPSLSVLLVDDDAQVRRSTAAMLAELGHSVVEAADGAAALVALERAKIDFAVVDFAMPRMDGAELTYRLRLRRPDLPVLMVTGFAKRAAAESRFDAPAHRLAKPFTLEKLAAAIAETLAGPPADRIDAAEPGETALADDRQGAGPD